MSMHRTPLVLLLGLLAAGCSAPSRSPVASQARGALPPPTALPSHPSGAVRVTVLDAGQFPLPGAVVWLCPVLPAPTGSAPLHSVTSGNGSALLAGIPVGSYVLRSALLGFRQPAPFPQVAVPLAGSISATVTLQLYFDPSDTMIGDPVVQPIAGPVSVPSPLPSPTPTPLPCAGPA
jgi:hypothetical protein